MTRASGTLAQWQFGMVRAFGLHQPPQGYTPVPVGREIQFLEKFETRKHQYKHGAKDDSNSFQRHTTWTVKKFDGIEFCECCGECETDVIVEKHVTKDGHALEPSRCGMKVDTSSGGQKRFRVWVNGEWLYLHHVLAFAFGRDWACPHVRDFVEFRRRKFQGDHLAWVRPGGLEVPTQPEWCFAGWIQAVAKATHDRRSRRLERARAVLRNVAAIEKKENEATQELGSVQAAFDALHRKNTQKAKKLKAKIKSLNAVKQAIAKKRGAGAKLLTKAQPQVEKYREAIKKRKGHFLTADGWDGKDGELKYFSSPSFPPILADLFVSAETTDTRRALMLFTNKHIDAQRKVR